MYVLWVFLIPDFSFLCHSGNSLIYINLSNFLHPFQRNRTQKLLAFKRSTTTSRQVSPWVTHPLSTLTSKSTSTWWPTNLKVLNALERVSNFFQLSEASISNFFKCPDQGLAHFLTIVKKLMHPQPTPPRMTHQRNGTFLFCWLYRPPSHPCRPSTPWPPRQPPLVSLHIIHDIFITVR